MKNCEFCKSDYIEIKTYNPIPDNVCAICGTELTDEKILELNKINDINK